jgi:hypothetical protein
MRLLRAFASVCPTWAALRISPTSSAVLTPAPIDRGGRSMKGTIIEPVTVPTESESAELQAGTVVAVVSLAADEGKVMAACRASVAGKSHRFSVDVGKIQAESFFQTKCVTESLFVGPQSRGAHCGEAGIGMSNVIARARRSDGIWRTIKHLSKIQWLRHLNRTDSQANGAPFRNPIESRT